MAEKSVQKGFPSVFLRGRKPQENLAIFPLFDFGVIDFSSLLW